jgi:hypothetical protein
VGTGDRQPVLADRVDLLGPGIDERDVVAGPGQEGSQIASDRACADEEELLGHLVAVQADAAIVL